ncbi:signal peptide protein [Kitasatospora sp. NPDC058190]|uniref:signal peptide protein n=1 Tax=Kitasatospora sp. NPDC058190 TaxID=3346371 RepID=UPI0036DCA4BF
MPTRTIRSRALVLTAAALAVLPTAVLAASSHAASTPAPASAATAAPVSFVDLPDTSLPSDNAPHGITVTYRNPASTDQTVAPQILIESPDNGPFLDPAQIRLELLGTDRHWHTVSLGSQTGTLYTDLIPAKIVLHGHHTLTEHYRVTVLKGPAQGSVEPRVAIYA